MVLPMRGRARLTRWTCASPLCGTGCGAYLFGGAQSCVLCRQRECECRLAWPRRALLALLDQHGSLGYEQIAALLEEQPNEVSEALSRLRGLGFVEALTLGDTEAHIQRSVSYWHLTDAGRKELTRLRAMSWPDGSWADRHDPTD